LDQIRFSYFIFSSLEYWYLDIVNFVIDLTDILYL